MEETRLGRTPTKEAAIWVDGLTKYYGPVIGVEDLSFEVGRGEMYGFLGANGAGKTTTIRLLLDLLRPSRGRAMVLGIDCRKSSMEARRRIGYLPGELPIYPDLTAAGYLDYLARLDGRPVAPEYRAELLERFDVSERGPPAPTPRSITRDEAENRHRPGSDVPGTRADPRRADSRARSVDGPGVSRNARSAQGVRRYHCPALVAHPCRGRGHVRPDRDHPQRPHGGNGDDRRTEAERDAPGHHPVHDSGRQRDGGDSGGDDPQRHADAMGDRGPGTARSGRPGSRLAAGSTTSRSNRSSWRTMSRASTRSRR